MGDGSVVLAGNTDGDWGEVTHSETDFAAVKIDDHGDVLWTWQVSHTRVNIW